MIGLSTERAPSPGVVVPYFAFSALSFLVLSLALFISVPELSGHFMNPRILALTHIAALGWITMIIMGALYQLVPVIFETGLYSQKLAKVNFYLFGSSLLVMVYAFWNLHFKYWLFISGAFVFLSFLLFSYNMLMSIKKSTRSQFAGYFVGSSVVWLLLTGLLGLLLTLNYTYPFLRQDQFNLLKAHAHFGIVGWLFFLVMGVSSVLVPMFLVSHDVKENLLKKAFYICNISLILISLDWLFLAGSNFMLFYVLAFVTGLGFFARYIYDSYSKKIRKLDIGMKHTMVSFIFLFIPVVIAIILNLGNWFEISSLYKFYIPYGISIFLGFFSNLILGQLYKTLPFIMWLHRYKKFVGKSPTPMPRELYSERLADLQFYTYLVSMAFFAAGFILDNTDLLKAGSLILILAALLFNINVFTVIFFRKPLKPN